MTLYLSADQPQAIDQAAALLREGQVVIFPTDTVYGIGVIAFDKIAIEQLYEAKERPLSKGLPVLLADLASLEQVAKDIPDITWPFIERFWPGSLTLILPKHPGLPANLSPNQNIAVRVPDHPITRQLIRLAGGAVAVSSANLSGQPPAGTAQESWPTFSGRVAAVLDGGPTFHTLPSTILDCTVDPPQILRFGLIAEQLPNFT